MVMDGSMDGSRNNSMYCLYLGRGCAINYFSMILYV